MHDPEIDRLNELNKELFRKLRGISKEEAESTEDSIQATINSWGKEIAKIIHLAGDPPEFQIKVNTKDKKAKPVTVTPLNEAADNILKIIRECGLTDVL